MPATSSALNCKLTSKPITVIYMMLQLDQLHPISGLLHLKQRLSSGLTSLRACFKPEIVVDKFLFGWALESILLTSYICLSKTSNPA